MTDRLNAFVVVLDRERREDDAESILNAIRMIKGVLSVEPVVSDISHHIAEDRAKHELRMKLFKALE